MSQWRVYAPPPWQGTSHKRRGDKPCQDRVMVQARGSVLVAVLSDGLGQLAYSHVAAETITRSVADFLWQKGEDCRRRNPEEWKPALLQTCRHAIQQQAQAQGLDPSQMDGTLLFAVLFQDAAQLLLGQLGDGAICLAYATEGKLVATRNDLPYAAANATKTVFSADAREHLTIQRMSATGVLGVILTSDGLENELYAKAGQVKKNLEWYFNLISNHEETVCDREIRSRWEGLASQEAYGFIDDMSLAAIVQCGQQVEWPEDVNWLCVCGHRNRLESTRCEHCGKDFTRLYKGVHFKQYFFAFLNQCREKEIQMLEEHSEYPLEPSLYENETGENAEDARDTGDAGDVKDAENAEDTKETGAEPADTVPSPSPSPQQTSAPPASSSSPQRRQYNGGIRVDILAGVLLAFLFGMIVQLSAYYAERNSFYLEARFLTEKTERLLERLDELEDSLKQGIPLSDGSD